MSSLNRVELIGRVGKDPEIRSLGSSGDRVASFSLATSETWKKDGERKERTFWHNVVCFNDNLTRVIEAYVKKGSLIYISGALQTREYEKDGAKRYATEVVVQKFRGELVLLDSKGGGGGDSYASDAGSSAKTTGPKESFDLDDEIPFATPFGLR